MGMMGEGTKMDHRDVHNGLMGQATWVVGRGQGQVDGREGRGFQLGLQIVRVGLYLWVDRKTQFLRVSQGLEYGRVGRGPNFL